MQAIRFWKCKKQGTCTDYFFILCYEKFSGVQKNI
jgi:hypothetical protein